MAATADASNTTAADALAWKALPHTTVMEAAASASASGLETFEVCRGRSREEMKRGGEGRRGARADRGRWIKGETEGEHEDDDESQSRGKSGD